MLTPYTNQIYQGMTYLYQSVFTTQTSDDQMQRNFSTDAIDTKEKAEAPENSETGFVKIPEGSFANKNHASALEKWLPLLKRDWDPQDIPAKVWEAPGHLALYPHPIEIRGWFQSIRGGAIAINGEGRDAREYDTATVLIDYDQTKKQFYLELPKPMTRLNVSLNKEVLKAWSPRIYFIKGKNTISFEDRPTFEITV